MAFSSTVSAGDVILASVYNNLRKDVLDTSGGHTHNETDSRKLANTIYDLGNAGLNNIRYGQGTLASLTTGDGNVCVGVNALASITIVDGCTAVGFEALASNITSVGVSAFGYKALTTGSTTLGGSSAFGYKALEVAVNGNNSAFGDTSSWKITTGQLNSSFGSESLYTNISSEGNSAFGYRSLYVATGENNVAFGRECLNAVTSGSNNIGLGYNAQVPTATADNQVRIGDGNITYAGVEVAWTITSDRRCKENIKDIDLGIDFINQLKPVVYNRKNDKSKKLEYGIIAQDLEKTLKQNNIKNTGFLTKDDTDKLHLRYNDFIAVLIKGMQEQSKQIHDLQIELNEVKKCLNTPINSVF